MDWTNGSRQGQTDQQPNRVATAPAGATAKKNKFSDNLRGLRLAQVGLLFLLTLLVIFVILRLVLGGGVKSAESSYVDDKKLQAVFLNGGQVYFGDITDLNGKFLSMQNIYYLRVNQQVQPNQSDSSTSNDISLVKLGCELHGPQDSMVINREQVIFWENLKDDGQVAKAVAEYKKQNPNGQKCDQTSQSTSNTGDTTNNATTGNNTNTTNNSTTTR